MRRKDREVTDFDEIVSILAKCRVLHLALVSGGMPYSVPVNFGYEVREEDGRKKLSVYFHGAGEGKKIDALTENARVSFCAERFFGAEGGEEPCAWTCYYESVIGFGKAEILFGAREKSAGLDTIMLHNGYKLPAGIKFIAYNAMALAKTAVVKIEVDEITGKRHSKK